MLPISLMTPDEIAGLVASNLKSRRLERNLTQEGLAERAGVSLGSLKRFERLGAISLENLIRLSIALDMAEDIAKLFDQKKVSRLDDLLRSETRRVRGRKK